MRDTLRIHCIEVSTSGFSFLARAPCAVSVFLAMSPAVPMDCTWMDLGLVVGLVGAKWVHTCSGCIVGALRPLCYNIPIIGGISLLFASTCGCANLSK